MGYTTDFIGRFDIDPPLNLAEQQYLAAFGQSRRYDGRDGPYAVPFNPAAERDARDVDVDTYNALATGQPSLWCNWRPSWDGAALAFDGTEKFYNATAWLVYLIDHFLAPTAFAQESGQSCFDDFTFDHVVDGVVAAHRRDTGRLYLIRAVDNAVTEHTLVPGASQWPDSLPYEDVLDRERAERRPRRRRLRSV